MQKIGGGGREVYIKSLGAGGVFRRSLRSPCMYFFSAMECQLCSHHNNYLDWKLCFGGCGPANKTGVKKPWGCPRSCWNQRAKWYDCMLLGTVLSLHCVLQYNTYLWRSIAELPEHQIKIIIKPKCYTVYCVYYCLTLSQCSDQVNSSSCGH